MPAIWPSPRNNTYVLKAREHLFADPYVSSMDAEVVPKFVELRDNLVSPSTMCVR